MGEWPDKDIWGPGDRGELVLASQGMRLWTVPCQYRVDGEALVISGVDETTIENLRRQRRVAFSVVNFNRSQTVQGSGLVHLPKGSNGSEMTMRLEPYRLVVGNRRSSSAHSYERRIHGWIPMTEQPTSSEGTFAFWYAVFRAVTLPLSVFSVVLAGAMALVNGRFDAPLFLLCAIGAALAHAGANAVSDYFDLKNGVDLPWALSSHLGALASERTDPDLVRSAALACFVGVALVGVVLVTIVGWPVVLFGLAGLAGGYFYTGGPVNYKYRAMGELWLGLLMGPMTAMGTYYVLSRGWDWSVFFLSFGLGLLISSVSLVNNLRDLPDDRAAMIRTLPMKLGIVGTKNLYYLLIGGSYLAALAAIGFDLRMWPVLAVFGSLPQARRAIAALRSTGNSEQDIRQRARQNPYPLNSIKLHMRFGTLAVVGVGIAWLLALSGLQFLERTL